MKAGIFYQDAPSRQWEYSDHSDMHDLDMLTNHSDMYIFLEIKHIKSR